MLKRSGKNPLITVNDLQTSHEELNIIGVFNPGACQFDDEIILLARVAEACKKEKGWIKAPIMNFKDGEPYIEIKSWKKHHRYVIDDHDPRKFTVDGILYLTSISHLRVLRSNDGINFSIETKPFVSAELPDESYGVEDPRITKIDDTFLIVYSAVSKNGIGVSLVSTKNFQTYVRYGMIFHPLNKDVCIFPEKINNYYVALHRPMAEPFNKPSIWYAESPDLKNWGNHSCLLVPNDSIWERQKIGVGPQPIKTDLGWLVLYHGCGENDIYALSLLLLDLTDPRRVIKRSVKPIMKPTSPYEKIGFFPNVVFSNGWIEKPNGQILIYYGAADECICLAETSLGELLDFISRES